MSDDLAHMCIFSMDVLCRTLWLDLLLMPISLIQPIANICWEFKRHEDIQNAK